MLPYSQQYERTKVLSASEGTDTIQARLVGVVDAAGTYFRVLMRPVVVHDQV